MSRVVFHIGEDGRQQVFADSDVEVIFVDENCPRDRVYRASPDAIPNAMIGGTIGHAGDGTPMDIRAKVFSAEMDGKPHLSVIEGGNP